MPNKAVRRGFWAVATGVVIALAILATVPMIASTRIVRDRIAEEISAWSGLRVDIAAAPEIEVWPSFRAILTGVTVSDPRGVDAEPVMQAQRMELQLSALAALSGDIRFSTARLVNPTVRLRVGADGAYLLPFPGEGRLARAIRSRSAGEGGGTPSPAGLASDGFGTLEWTAARVVVHDGGEDRPLLTDLAGRLSWPSPERAAALATEGVWRGEHFTLEASAPQPLTLLAGTQAPFVASFASAPVNASFDGSVNLSTHSYVDGQVKLSAPSLRRLLEWSGSTISTGSTIGTVNVAGRMSAADRRLKLDNAAITLDGNQSVGVLELSLQNSLPAVAGTLAFEALDLDTFITTFTPLEPDAGNRAGNVARRVNLDLRLSATRASAVGVALTDVAATAQVKGGLSVFDISDATALGGAVQASIKLDDSLEDGPMELRFMGTDIDGAAFGNAVGMTRLLPAGRGNLSLILRGRSGDWATMLETAKGSVSASFGQATLSGFDLAGFLQRARARGFFPLDEVAGGSLRVEGLEVKATIAGGIARMDKAEARTAQERIVLTGIVPYMGRGLALTGAVFAHDKAQDRTADTPMAAFFVGGSWGEPFISPMLGPIQPQE